MLKKFRLLWYFMQGHRLLYISAIIALGLATIFSLMSPLVIKTTIDSIIGDKPFLNLPDWLLNMIESTSGRSYFAQNLWMCSIILVGLASANGILIFLKGKWAAIASESIAKNIRERLYDHLQHLPYDYHVKAETGDLIQRCTSDVDTIRRFLAMQLIGVGQSILKVAIVMPIMLALNVKMTFIAMAIIPLLFLFSLIFFGKVRVAFKRSDEADGYMSTVLQENLTGVRVVRAFARQQHEMEKFDNANLKYRDLTYRVILTMGTYWSISEFLGFIQVGTVLIIGSYWAALQVISLGTFVAFSTYVGMLIWPIRQLGRILADLGRTFVSIERIQEILEQPSEKIQSNSLKPPINGELELHNVSFAYEPDKPILKNISFKVKSGQTVAILGPTGSGKSSLVHLLAGLYDYQDGCIKIDGIELKTINKKWLRQHVGIVLQEPFLFSKTIKDNIRLARMEAHEEQVFEVAQIAAIHDVILNFEKGYETPVGEKGVTLSGGQKQRVAISRTLIRECPVLIFDDSLSAVDTETDAAIRNALKSNGFDGTTFIISHRIVTLSQADVILVLEKGELVQVGTHTELINQPGLYQRIWAIQNALEEELDQESIAA